MSKNSCGPDEQNRPPYPDPVLAGASSHNRPHGLESSDDRDADGA